MRIEVNKIPIDVFRKDIKNLHLSVHPPTGRIRISAPLFTSNETIRLFVVSKISWIKKHQRNFLEQKRQTEREYVSGESHYFKGARYLLDVIYKNQPGEVKVNGRKNITLIVPRDKPTEYRERVMTEWYRGELKAMAPVLIAKWELVVNVQVSDWRVRKMKTKWGSCNEEAGRIWLNLELIKKPVHCLEYIIVYELVHFIEMHHDERFVELMDKFMPKWRSFKDELNSFPLAYADWEY